MIKTFDSEYIHKDGDISEKFRKEIEPGTNHFLSYSLKQFENNDDINPIKRWFNSIPEGIVPHRLIEWKKKHHYLWVEIQRLQAREIIKEMEKIDEEKDKVVAGIRYLNSTPEIEINLEELQFEVVEKLQKKKEKLWSNIPPDAMAYAKRYIKLKATGQYDIEDIESL